ncbi:thaumatin-like protein 1b isoform X1 [Ananas comosus]|uniref:Thaumatin-like protein 1b isoform X1 n=1 Tax=Ananas comosus TaxID=4615 RepID=A0A6P5FDP9_ANACO|nr:thaumatin-like protein 1b isoform X1 [Ananas comosus]
MSTIYSVSFWLLFFVLVGAGEGTTFTFVNRCGGTVWPGVLSNSGSPQLESTGFELASGASRTFVAPTGWSGRFWARTGCNFDASDRGSCATGDCGSGQLQCNGAGAAPPATLAEFTLSSSASSSSAAQDFYDVSLVDGYNLPMTIEANGGTGGGGGGCAATGCAADLNKRCPAELRVGEGEGEACRSACEAFAKPEFCCSGAFASPAACRPSVYSQMFKSACPKSYSYAFDDPTSTFTCSGGAGYTITFCPASSPPSSQKSSRDSPSTPKATGGVMLEDDSWLASLATGEASTAWRDVPFIHQPFLILFIVFLLL